MTKDNEVTPRLGRIRAKGGRSYLPKVLKAAQRAGGVKRIVAAPRSANLSRGRGSGLHASGLTGQQRGPSARRAIVKARFTRLSGKGFQSAGAHLRYLQRDGVTQEGAPGRLYGAEIDKADVRAFMDRCRDDRHQFRFIISAEDGDQYEDLKPVTRRLMAEMETDLGTRLDWVAVDHFNTGHPHTHIVVRGRDEAGQDLVIASDYIAHGVRERLSAIIALDLGPRTAQEIAAGDRAEMNAPRWTGIDRKLLQRATPEQSIDVRDWTQSERALAVGRLRKLEGFGLAEATGPCNWRLSSDFESTLRAMGQRGDIIKTLHFELRQKALIEREQGAQIHLPNREERTSQPIIGRAIKRGLTDDGTERQFLIVDGIDGHAHWIDIGVSNQSVRMREDTIVEVRLQTAEVRPADKIIAMVAEENAGRYDVDGHLRHDPSATQAFAETHIRRLEAIRRAGGDVTRDPDGGFQIGANYLATALEYEHGRVDRNPVEVETLSILPPDRLATYEGATWLDRQIFNDDVSLSEAGFGKEVNAALRVRQKWLLEQGLASEPASGFVMTANALTILSARDVERAGVRIAKDTGRAFQVVRAGEKVEGLFQRAVELPSGKFAVIERERDFTLVPWRPVLEGHAGKAVSGLMREGGINWKIARDKSVSRS